MKHKTKKKAKIFFSKNHRERSHNGSYHDIVNSYHHVVGFQPLKNGEFVANFLYLQTWKKNNTSKELVTNTAGVPSTFGILYGWLGPSAAPRRVAAS